MKTLADIRSTFLKFFEENGHTVVEASSLVPNNDPTLMFTNSGMVQFKNVFTGMEKRFYTRATTAQKSVRAGGKHNDLENVGYTARHHTFFEMMGNFSFGDYFKEEAIYFAWTLITKHFGLSKDKLLVTVYHDDYEAADLWKKIAGFSDDKIIRIPTDDNFWRMGDVGPCGPCSEIFIDQGDKLQGGPPGSPDEDGDRFLEFWNLVFMQFEESATGRTNLPRPSIDTGMGLERMAAILQGKTSNYDIDLFQSLIGATADLVKIDPEGPQKPSFRVIADHLRATSFLIADGVMPSNEGRGYVLRRIMRRGMRHAHLLGAKEPLIYRLVSELVKLMGVAYPELVRAEALITETLKLEESRFKQTLDRGLKLLDEESANLSADKALPGAVAFKLYDTFGFPLDLTQDVLRGRGLKVDVAGFETAMEKQREEARKSWAGSGDAGTSKVWFELADELGGTDFLGYSTEKAEGQIKAIVKGGARVDNAAHGDEVAIVVNQSPYYAESGGQVGDTGTIKTTSGAVIRITDTQKEAGRVFVHRGVVESGSAKVGDEVALIVDGERRAAIRANHSATHLLHEVLRRLVGTHVAQKGSMVSEERLRFDVSQPVPIGAEKLAEVEREVNRLIRKNTEVGTRLMTPKEAMDAGAMALFGEKYGEEVRVVSMGGQDEALDNRHAFSVELCGGTHVKRTGDIGVFKILSESAVSAGVRRIEALTGAGALAYFVNQEKQLDGVAEAMKAPVNEVAERVVVLLEERKKLEREVSDLRRQVAMGGGASNGAADEGKLVNGVTLISRSLTDMPAKDLKPMADAFKSKIKSGVVVLASSFEGKVSLVVAVTDDLTKTISAVDLVKVGAEALGGKGGGGRPDMAQAGGTNPNAIPQALAAIEAKLVS
ncbi:MAG: alanine--tRNA ligase [Proteobacteria bacterium]|jgi:alanyl-tRNA synthetase|nr:alanine--tRNA ligase [Alphaproteobacteria bacterium]NCC02710.1 alanine--tRNA ligase [Pseudomonadota bacterium]